jgi:uncharacterized iron-regulated membrane protein
MTKRLWQLHSWLGLIAGLGLLVIGVTGSLLVFRDQLDGIFAAKLMCVEPTKEGRLSWDRLLTAAQQAWPGYEVTGFGPRTDPHLADLVYVKKRGSHEFRAGTLNPYTGAALSSPMNPSETFTGILLELHYTWFAEHVGMLTTGIFAVLLCLLGVTGVWMYRGFWKSFFTLRWGRSARIFFSDLHKMVGISSVGFNLILGFTGAYWNLTHVAEDGLGHHDAEEDKVTGRLYADTISIEALAATATKQIPGFEARWVSFPTKAGEDLTLWGKVPATFPLSGDYGSSVAFDPQTGAVKTTTDLRQAGVWMKFTDTFTALHFGTFGGLPIKILWVLGGLAPGILATSGFLIWRARRSALPLNVANRI